MCLITTKREPSIATEDIIVTKLFRDKDKLYSPFRGYEYEYDKLYETDFTFKDKDGNWEYFSSNVFNYYDKIYRDCLTRNKLNRGNLMCIVEGFHSLFGDAETIIKKHGVASYLKPIKCIVPKGAKYYLDETGLIVSNKLLIKSIL